MGARVMTRRTPMNTSADERTVEAHNEVAAGARDVLSARLRAQSIQNIGRWTREELYSQESGKESIRDEN